MNSIDRTMLISPVWDAIKNNPKQGYGVNVPLAVIEALEPILDDPRGIRAHCMENMQPEERKVYQKLIDAESALTPEEKLELRFADLRKDMQTLSSRLSRLIPKEEVVLFSHKDMQDLQKAEAAVASIRARGKKVQ